MLEWVKRPPKRVEMHLTKMVMFSNERPNKSKTQKLYLPSVVYNKKEDSFEEEFPFGLLTSQVSEIHSLQVFYAR